MSFNPDMAGAWSAISGLTGVLFPILGIVLGLGLVVFAVKAIRDNL